MFMIVIFFANDKTGERGFTREGLVNVFLEMDQSGSTKKAIPTFTALDNLEPGLWPNIV